MPEGARVRLSDVLREGILLKERSRPAVYAVHGACKTFVHSLERVDKVGISWEDIRMVPGRSPASSQTVRQLSAKHRRSRRVGF